ncbi:MAG: sigma-70 family RNA polymerase sigma factor [Planctomycetaceae bacterium]|nr:sigma-70 family RNA polymerase sigma factor [Planctomycetaceae bacterium]
MPLCKFQTIRLCPPLSVDVNILPYALRMLDQNLYNAICRYVGRLLSDEELVKDITQEVFLRLEQNQHNVHNQRSWVYKTARNLVIDHYRHRSHAAHAVAVGEMVQNLPANTAKFNPAILAEKKESIKIMLEKLNKLSPRHREVLRLKFQEGLKYNEIAEITNESITTVSWLLHEALSKLRKELNPKQKDKK